jgi:hypothetical protein
MKNKFKKVKMKNKFKKVKVKLKNKCRSLEINLWKQTPHRRNLEQGCQMLHFKTKNWFILEGLKCKRLVHLYIHGQLEYINAFVIHIL